MSQRNFMALKAAIYKMGLYFNQQPTEDRINAYAEALGNYSDRQVIFAFKKVVDSGSAFFPSLAEILAHLKPSEDLASDIGNTCANEIIQTCIDKGRYRSDEIIKELSPVSAEVVIFNRYLIMEILDSDSDQIPTIRAQIRDLVKGIQNQKKNEEKNLALDAVGIKKGRVLSLPSNGMKALDYKDN